MRHATQSQRLGRPTDHRQADVHNLVKSLLAHGQIETTFARAKVAQRLADRLVTLGKEGSLHARRRAFRVLQNRTLVRQLFVDIAPRFVDVSGGYTRVVRLSIRRGDGAQKAVLALSRLPATRATKPAEPKGKAPQPAPSAPERPKPKQPAETEKPKGFFEGLRGLWPRKKKGSAAP